MLEPRELAGIPRLEELAHEVRGPREEDAALLRRGFDAKRDRQMRLPGPEGPARIRFSGAVTHSPRASVWICVVEALGRRKVKRVERLDLGEARLAQPLAGHRLMPRRPLGTEDLLQIVFVRPVGIARLARQTLEDAGGAGQLQRTGVRKHEVSARAW